MKQNPNDRINYTKRGRYWKKGGIESFLSLEKDVNVLLVAICYLFWKISSESQFNINQSDYGLAVEIQMNFFVLIGYVFCFLGGGRAVIIYA